MTSFVAHTSVDCHDSYALSEWWKKLLGYVDLDGDPNEPDHEECMIRDPESGHLHSCSSRSLTPRASRTASTSTCDRAPATRDEETERVLALGATLVEDHRGDFGPGTGWAVLADPEGNEFCILRSEAEVAATSS